MKNTLLGVVFIVLLAACQQDDSGTDQPIDESTPSVDQEQNNVDDSSKEESPGQADESDQETLSDDQYMTEKMSSLDYYEFELEVEYADDQEYEAEIEPDKHNSFKAEIEDELNNIYLKGIDAFNEIYEKLEQLSITSTSKREDVIQQVLQVFDLPDNYQEFEVEIKFHDGTELEIEDHQ